MYEPTRRDFLRGTATIGLLAASTTLFDGVARADGSHRPATLATAGNHLVDPAGHVVQLAGVNIIQLGTGSTDPKGTVPAYISHALGVWRSSLIRLSIRQDFWLAGADYRTIVQNAVEQVSAAGSYIILDLHGKTSVPNMPDDTSASTFWPQVAAAYRNNPAVLFGIYNEPAGITWDIWQNGGNFTSGATTYHTPGLQALVDGIRGTGAKNVIVAGTPEWCTDFSELGNGFGLTDPTGNGIVYDAHIYPWHQWLKKGTGWVTAARDYPMLMGEFGHDGTDIGLDVTVGQFGGSSPMIYWAIELGAIDALGLNSTAWSFHPFGGPRLITDDTNFTPAATSGQFVLDRLLNKAEPRYATTIGNSGFESPTTRDVTYRPDRRAAGWTFTGNAGVQRSRATAVHGAQTAFLQTGAATDPGANGVAGAIAQDITFAATGTYTVSLLAAARTGKEPASIVVALDDVPISSVSYTATQVTGTDSFAPITTAPFTVNRPGRHRLSLAVVDADDDREILLDSVTIGAIASAVIQDQGFQNPTVNAGTYAYLPTTSLPHWTYRGNAGVEQTALGAPLAPEGRGAHSNSLPQAAFLQTAAATDAGATGQDGSISQDIEFGAPGTYQLDFMAAYRSGRDPLPIRILVDGTLIDTITPTSTGFEPYSTKAFAIDWPGFHTVEFAASPSPNVDREAFIDATGVSVPVRAGAGPRPVALMDAGFETPSAAGIAHGIQPVGEAWTFTGTTVGGFGFAAGIQADASSFTSYGGHKAPEGWQTAYLTSDGTAVGVISQRVRFPADGTYVITFQAQPGRGGGTPVTVSIDDRPIGTYTPTLRAFYPAATDRFTVTAGEHTLAFTGGTTTGTTVFTLIDAVNIWPA